MLRRTLVRHAKEARRPLISFPDRKAAASQQQQGGEHTPHPHPAAPGEVAKDFEHFKQAFSSGPHFRPEKLEQQQQSSSFSSSSSTSASGARASGGSGTNEVAEDVHDLPKRFWHTPALAFEEKEMDAVMSGGATLIQGK